MKNLLHPSGVLYAGNRLFPLLAAAKPPQDTNLLQRQIDATNKQIDQLVYALYGLNDEEIALVEGASTP